MPLPRLAAALLSLVWLGPAAKAPVTHEAIWLMKRAGAPAVSPDGKWVAFSLTEPAYDEKDQVADVWLVPADGSARPRRLTFTKGAESGLAWSPDSRRLAFTARREDDEATQVYVLDLAGGEAVRLTSLSTGASSPRWSPDGRQLLFTSMVYPGATDDEANKKIAAERKARKHKARVYESFPIRQWDRWLDDRHAHLFVQAAEPGAKTKDLLAGTRLAAEPGFGGVPSALGGEDLDAVWAPDGQSVVFAATARRTAAAYSSVSMHLYQAAVSGGEPRQLTTGDDSYRKPAFRPDGQALYGLYERHTGKVYNLDRVAMFSWPAMGERTVATASFDRSISGFVVSPDSRTLYLLAEDAGHEKLYSAPAQGGEVRLAMQVTSGVYTNLASPERAAAPVLIANWESAISPAEVVRIEPERGRHAPLTEFNAERASAIDWQPVRHFWFTSRGGKPIHNMIALPPGFDQSKKYPLLVLMHGGPHSMWRDQFFLRWNYHLLAEPGYVVLLTNYTGSTGFGEKFAQEIQGDPFKGPADEINEAADEAIRRFPFIDGARQAAGGASYGGHLANWMQATTTRYKCLISHAGLINLESQWGTSDMIYHREVSAGGPVWEQGPVWRQQNPIRFAANFRTPILLTVGERDFRVPLNQTLENWSVLQRLRIPSRLVVFEDANHWILKGDDSRFFYQELHAWLKKHLFR
ncbi:MAG: S9 family peptidase [Acidobacteriota bacterium]